MLLTSLLYSQNNDFEKFDNAYENNDYQKSLNELIRIDTINISDYNKATWYFYYADVQSSLDKHAIAYRFAKKSETLFELLNEQKDAIDAKFLILDILSHQNELKIDTKPILDEISIYAIKYKDSATLLRTHFRYGHLYLGKDNRIKALSYYRNALHLSESLKDTLNIAYSFMSFATVYNTIKPFELDSSLHYNKKAVPLLKKSKKFGALATNYNNQAEVYLNKGDFLQAIHYYKKADSIPLVENIAKTKVIFYENIAKAYDSIGNYKAAAAYYKKKIQLTDSINDIAQNINIVDIIEKNKTAELKADNAKINTYLTIALSILALVVISAFFIQKNTRKKQLLAEQAIDLEAQKVENLLQEQELASIDAMIEGQEKERKRIAEDLHDDLGALMATINLHLENVGNANNPNALSKTKTLLSEAYNKIRTMSHIKNAGVIATKGLLVSVTNMASKISSANKVYIEVIAHGLEDRLENSLELSLFRIIQELTANIVKHSQATKATIQLTQYDKSLNILVEDNGIGFDVSQNKTASGIGLENIKKRVEHMEGSFTIDSTPTVGTTIIIEVPIV